MVAEFGKQQWSCTNFRCSDRTLRSRDRIFDFSQEMVKICEAAWILGIRGNFDRSCRYNQPVQYGRDAAHGLHVWESTLSTRIWTRALQPNQEEVSSGRFCRAQIVRGRQTFPLNFWLSAEIFIGAEISTSAIVLSYAWIFTRRINSVCPPKFSAAIFRLNFRHPPQFSWDAGISCICQRWAALFFWGVRFR